MYLNRLCKYHGINACYLQTHAGVYKTCLGQ